MIGRLQHVGWAVRNLGQFGEDIARLLAFNPVDIRSEDGINTCRVVLPNDCWLQVVHDEDPDSRVGRFLREHGEGLEHVAFTTSDLDADVARLRALGVRFREDAGCDPTRGARAIICADDVVGFPVELIQHSSDAPDGATAGNPNLLGLQHIGVSVVDLGATARRFEELFGLRASGLRLDQHGGDQRDMMVEPGNDRLWLHLVETHVPDHRMYRFRQQHGPGLEHLCIEFADIRRAVRHAQEAGVALEQNKIYLDREDGFEAFVMAEDDHGVTIELIEPYPTSRGYRPDKPSVPA